MSSKNDLKAVLTLVLLPFIFSSTNRLCFSRCPINLVFLFVIAFIIVLLSLTSSSIAPFVFCSTRLVPINLLHRLQFISLTPFYHPRFTTIFGFIFGLARSVLFFRKLVLLVQFVIVRCCIVIVRSLDKCSITLNESIAFAFLHSQFSIVCILKTVEKLPILML